MPLKRFLSTPPQAPTKDYQVANKKYVDDTVAAVTADGLTQDVEVRNAADDGTTVLRFVNGILTAVDPV